MVTLQNTVHHRQLHYATGEYQVQIIDIYTHGLIVHILCYILQSLYIYVSAADDMLKRLEDERNLYEMRLLLPAEHLFGEQDKKDIFEHWNEEKLDEWRSKKQYLYTLSRNIFVI